MLSIYLNLNHDQKTFETSTSLLDKFSTKEIKDEQKRLISLLKEYPDYVGKINGYGSSLRVKSAKDFLENNLDFCPHYDFIDEKLIGAVCYIFSEENDLAFFPDLYLDLVYKEHNKKHNSLPFNLFTFDKENNQYVNKNLQEFLKRNNFINIRKDSQSTIQCVLNDSALKTSIDNVISYIRNNFKTYLDLENYSKNLIG